VRVYASEAKEAKEAKEVEELEEVAQPDRRKHTASKALAGVPVLLSVLVVA
jgi:hypothetical protein